MNKLLVAILGAILLGVCITVNAAPIMYTKNNSNGKIVLTDEKCLSEAAKGRLAYSTKPNEETLVGCWTNDEIAIHIFWAEKYLRSYEYTDWVILKKDDPTM